MDYSLIPRSGTRDQSVVARYDYWQYDASANTTKCWETGYPSWITDFEQFQGYAHPHFHRRVRAGKLLSHTPWRQYKQTSSRSGSIGPLTAYVKVNDYDTWWSTGNYPIVSGLTLSAEELETLIPANVNSLVQGAAAQIVGESHDTLTFLAELSSVRNMFVETAKGFLKREIPRNWRQMSNAWLNARYGWRPLMKDCEDLQKAVKRLDEKRTRYCKKSKVVETYSNSVEVTYDSTLAGTAFRLSKSMSDTVEISCVGTVTADITIPAFSFNAAATLWEMTPYSFVVDWVIGIGQSIAALTFLAMNHRYTASWGCRVKVSRGISIDGYSIKSGVTGTCTGTGTGYSTLEVRVPCSVPTTPHLSFKIDTAKVVDLLGLIIQRI